MQPLEWTIELIITASVAGLVLAVLGYLLAMVLLGRKNTELSGQLKQTEQALELANTQSQKQQEDIKQLSAALHEKDLSESKLQTRLDRDRKSTRLNSSHVAISYAVFCLKKKRMGLSSSTSGRRRSTSIA